MMVASPWQRMRSAPPPELEDEVLFEIEYGQWIKRPEPGIAWTFLASRLGMELARSAGNSGHGHVVGRVLFHLPLPSDVCRRPAAAFVSYERWPKERPLSPTDNAWDVVPNLAVEIVRDQSAADMLGRVEAYFRAGVEMVWVFYPCQRIVHAYDSFAKIRVLTRADALDGGTILPRFRLPLSELFHEENPPQ